MDVLFTSDLHFGHELVAGLRGFSSAEEHDEAIIRRWNAVVRPDDRVWVLGDVSLNMTHGLSQCRRLNGNLDLLWGNHDAGSPVSRDSWRHQARYMEVFRSADSMRRIRLAGHHVMLSHYPYDGDHHDTGNRHMQFRLRDEGSVLIHGHLHVREQTSRSRPDGPVNQIHVGLDAWDLRPVPSREIVRLLAEISAA